MITKGNWETFLTLSGEQLLLVQRRHFFVVIPPILFASIGGLFFFFLSFFLFIFILSSIQLFLITSLIIFSFTLSFITKTIIEWYFHVYVLTTRKILEVRYTPLSSHVMSDILLDRVSCTEVDLQINGFFNEILHIGDIVITFDRPTHQEEFVLRDIKECDKIGKFLTKQLIDYPSQSLLQPIWFRKPVGTNSALSY